MVRATVIIQTSNFSCH